MGNMRPSFSQSGLEAESHFVITSCDLRMYFTFCRLGVFCGNQEFSGFL